MSETQLIRNQGFYQQPFDPESNEKILPTLTQVFQERKQIVRDYISQLPQGIQRTQFTGDQNPDVIFGEDGRVGTSFGKSIQPTLQNIFEANQGQLKKICTEFFDCRLNELLVGLQLLIVYSGTNTGTAELWHRDSFPLKNDTWDALNLPADEFPVMLTILIPIQDTHPQNGVTQLLPNSQNTPLSDLFQINEKGFQEKLDPQWKEKIVPLPMKRGEFLIFDSREVHRGGANVCPKDRGVYILIVSRDWYKDLAYDWGGPPVLSPGERPHLFTFDLEGKLQPR